MPDKRLSELPESLAGATTVGLYGYDTNGESVQVSPDKVAQDANALQTVATLAELPSNPFDGQEIDVIGFYNNWQGLSRRPSSGGIFVYDVTRDKADHNTALVIDPLAIVAWDGTQADLATLLNWVGSGSGCWVRKGYGPINPEWTGAVFDGATLATLALTKAHAIEGHFEYPAGSLLIDGVGGIPVLNGSVIKGQFGGRFSTNTNRTTKITNNTAGGGIFWNTISGTGAQLAAPQIDGFNLVADYPIKFNDRTLAISDGGSVQPYLMIPKVLNCSVAPRVSGVGYGIDMAKCFDGFIQGNEIRSFDINLLLAGCDINNISTNRITYGTTANIVDFSTSTFGSQNEIRNNDILQGSATCTLIMTNNRHVRIYDNYLEATSAVKGFIDLSNSSMPAIFGSNAPAISFSIDVDANRIDGFPFATDFVYRLKPTCPSIKIHDLGTTSAIPTAPALLIETTDNLLPVFYNGTHPFVQYDIKGETFGDWCNFSTHNALESSQGLSVTAQTYASLSKNASIGNNAGSYTNYAHDSIVIRPTHTVTQSWYPPLNDVGGNEFFQSYRFYSVKFTAKTTSPLGDTFRLARLLDGVGGSLVNYSLTEDYQTFEMLLIGSSATSPTGVYFTRSTFNGNIHIKNLTFEADGEPISTGAPSSRTVDYGQVFKNSSPAASGYLGWVCTVGGTAGTLNGGATTGSISSGTNSLTVDSVSGLFRGAYITIAGVSGVKKVLSISGLVVLLDSTADATVSSAAVAYSPFTVKSYGAISA